MFIPGEYDWNAGVTLALGGLMLLLWYRAGVMVKRSLGCYAVPVTLLAAVFCGLLQSIEISLFYGAMPRCIGGVLVALSLGPWVAVLAVSAVVFAQGVVSGSAALGQLLANAFNLAILMPWIGYWLYQFAAKRLARHWQYRSLVIAVAGAGGSVVAAMAACLETWLLGGLLDTTIGILGQIVMNGLGEGLLAALAIGFVTKKEQDACKRANCPKG